MEDRVRNIVRSAAVLFIAAACSSPTADRTVSNAVTAGTPVEVSLRVGEGVRVDSVLSVDLLSVSNDSRCAVDVVCVWVGTAAVELGLTMGDGPTRTDTLWTTFHADTTFAGYAIALLELAPEPHSGRKILPGDYVVRLAIGRE